MAASPSKKEIARVMRRALRGVSRRLAGLGLVSVPLSDDRLMIYGSNYDYAGFDLLRASNGEVAFYPYVMAGDGSKSRGFNVFDSIARA